MIKTAFHTGFLPEYSACDAVRKIMDFGYDLAELNAELLPWGGPHVSPETPVSERRELARLAPFAAISAHHGNYGNADPALNAGSIEHTNGLIDLADELGIKIVHVIAGPNAEINQISRALGENLKHAERRSITLAIEPIVNRLIGTKAGTLDILRRVPGLQVNFDPSHLQVMDHETVSAAHELGPKVAHVHIKDATGSPDHFAFVPLGTGEIDFTGIMQGLLQHDYDGAISVEHESHFFADDPRPLDQVLRESKHFLDELLASTRGLAKSSKAS